MTAKKFDINNLPDLKIRVAQEQIGRVLDCFKQLGAKEYPTCFFQDETILYFFYMPDLQRVEFSFREKNFIKDCGQEISLEQLEALAAEKQGLNSFETMVDETTCRCCQGNGKPDKALDNTWVESPDFPDGKPGDAGNTLSKSGEAVLVDCLKCEHCGHSWKPGNKCRADEQVAELRGEPLTLQQRFFDYWNQEHNILTLASDFWEMRNLLGEEAQGRYEAAREYMAKFPNGSAPLVGGYVDKALRIAAGLEQPPPNTDTKSETPK